MCRFPKCFCSEEELCMFTVSLRVPGDIFLRNWLLCQAEEKFLGDLKLHSGGVKI